MSDWVNDPGWVKPGIPVEDYLSRLPVSGEPARSTTTTGGCPVRLWIRTRVTTLLLMLGLIDDEATWPARPDSEHWKERFDE